MKRFLLVYALLMALLYIGACAPVVPEATPAVAIDEPPPTYAVPQLPRTPPPTPLPSDAAFESDAAPLSRGDFTLTLPNGAFCLLDQGARELEELLGLEFYENKLQTEEFLFTQLSNYVDSVFFLNSPTPRGIGLGASLDEIFAAYGTPSEIDDFGDGASYLYYLAPEAPDGLDFSEKRPLWYYAVGFSVSNDRVDRAFIADWTTE